MSLTATTVPAEPEAAPPSVPCGSRSSEGIAVAIRGQGSPCCVPRGRLVVSPPLPLMLRHSGGFPASLCRQGVAAPRRPRCACVRAVCVRAACVVHAPRWCVRPGRVRRPCASPVRASAPRACVWAVCVRAACVRPRRLRASGRAPCRFARGEVDAELCASHTRRRVTVARAAELQRPDPQPLLPEIAPGCEHRMPAPCFFPRSPFSKSSLYFCVLFSQSRPRAAGLSCVLFPIAARSLSFFCLLSTLIKLIHSFIHSLLRLDDFAPGISV